MRYSKVKSDVGNHAEFSQQIWTFLNFTIFEILKSRPQNFGTDFENIFIFDFHHFHRVPRGGHGEIFQRSTHISKTFSPTTPL